MTGYPGPRRATLVIVNWDNTVVQVIDRVNVLYDRRNSQCSPIKYHYVLVSHVKLSAEAAAIKHLVEHRGHIAVELIDDNADANIYTNCNQAVPKISLEEARDAIAALPVVNGARAQQEKVLALIAAKEAAKEAATADSTVAVATRPQDSLIIFREGSRMLEEANTIQRTHELHNLALTSQDWLRRKNAGKEAIDYCRRYALDAQKKMGVLLSQADLADGGTAAKLKAAKARSTPSTELPPPTKLADLGVTKNESSQAQKLASLPVEVFEAVRNGTKTKASVLAPQTERNTEVGCKLAAMTSEVQEWVDQFGVVYLRRQYSDEFKRLVSVVVGTSREKCLFQHNLP